jgi:hypothetical protein
MFWAYVNIQVEIAMSNCLRESDPELITAAKEALLKIKPVGPQLTREATFKYKDQEWWTKLTIDTRTNTIERWDVFPACLRHHRW